MIWSRNEQWMLTGDDKGYIKYWQANMNNVKMFQGHLEAIRGLRYNLTDTFIDIYSKFVLLLCFCYSINKIKYRLHTYIILLLYTNNFINLINKNIENSVLKNNKEFDHFSSPHTTL